MSATLPPAARERIEKLAAGGPWSSHQGVGEESALRSLGFSPAGVVIGSVYSWGFPLRPGPGYRTNPGALTPRPVLIDDPMSARRSGGFVHDWAVGPDGKPRFDMGWTWQRMLHEARERQIVQEALNRLLTEARGISAHGVIGIEVGLKQMGTVPNMPGYKIYELRLQGTAVIAPGAPTPAAPFTSGLGSAGVYKLAQHGYMPSRFVIGIAAVRGELGSSSRRRLRSLNNGEVEQFSEVTQQALNLARSDLERHVAVEGGLVLGAQALIDVDRELGMAYDVTVRIPGTVVRPFQHQSARSNLSFTPVLNLTAQDSG